MPNIEQIVRPFQSPSTLPTRRVIANSTKITTKEAIVEWGRAGDLPAPIKREDTTGGLAFEVVDCDDRFDQEDRKFNVIRIENPDDPSQYVMVERTNQLRFKKTNENEQLSYNNETTSFVTLPAFEGTAYNQMNNEQKRCNITYNFRYNV